MNVIAYSNAFGHFAEMIEKVCDDHAPVVIIRDFSDHKQFYRTGDLGRIHRNPLSAGVRQPRFTLEQRTGGENGVSGDALLASCCAVTIMIDPPE